MQYRALTVAYHGANSRQVFTHVKAWREFCLLTNNSGMMKI